MNALKREVITSTTKADDAVRIWEHDQREIAKFIQITRGQREEADLEVNDIDFHDIWCHECDAQETSPKPESLKQFAQRVYELNWHILSVEDNHVECPKCADYEKPESSWSRQYQAGSGGVL